MGINQINALKIINQKKIGNKIFTCKFNHCGKVGQKAANFQEHEAYKNERLKNWKKKEKEVREAEKRNEIEKEVKEENEIKEIQNGW